MSRIIPEGWEVCNLGKKIDVLSGFPFKSSEFTNDSSDFGLIRIRDLLNQNLETFYSGEYSTDYVVKKGDVLIGMDGDFNIVQWKSQNALLNQRICKLVPKKDGFDIKFVHYFLIPELKLIHNQTTATTVKHLSVNDIREVEKAFPPLPEQQKIASILTSVDEMIEKTQLQTDKLQDLKKATMNELLTKGIGHTEFKDSELGRIPKSWNEITFENALNLKIIEEIQDGNHGAQHPKASDYAESGVPFVMARDLKDGKIDLTNISYIPKTVYQKLRIGFAIEGDILLTHKATIGVTAIIQEGISEVMCTPQVTYYRIGNSSILNKFFLFYWFQSDIFQNELSMLSGQSTRNYIGITAQKDLFLRLPPMNEQCKIIEVIKSIDQKLKLQKQKLSKTQSLKKSLMQDLLTGKVRVKVN